MSPAGASSEFSLPDIRCAACIAKIEEGLTRVPGVTAARVNFTAKRLTVDHAPALDDQALRRAIGALGFIAEPVTPPMNAEGRRPAESRALLRALGVAGFAAMNVMLLSVAIWSGAEGPTRAMFHWLSALIAMPAVAYAGQPFFRSAWTALRHRRTNMDVPISIGVLLATGLSLFETIVGGRHAYFDGAVSLLFFLLAGRVLDSAMRDRARSAATALMRQTAPGGTVLHADGSSAWARADAIVRGMTLVVGAGERLAADGIVIRGRSSLDGSLITGESRPEPVAEDDPVIAGMLNLDAPLLVRVTAAGPDTAIAGIARLMEAAGQGRSRYVRIADRAARLYAPAVHLLALLSFVGWMAAGAGWHQSLLVAVAVLIITCPCALGLAVPVAQVVAAGALMRRGVLVKDGSALERLAEVDCVRFDKTGTLTLGRPEPAGPLSLGEGEAPVALALAQASRHPLAGAIARTLERQGVRAAEVADLAEEPGFGLSGLWRGRPVRLGRPDWVGAAPLPGEAMLVAFRVDGEPLRLLAFHDPVRPDAAETVARLEALGLQAAILSGDRGQAVLPVARALGMPAAVRLTPADKLDLIGRLTGAGRKVLMVGDGLNDGPALAAGHASMAPASASDVGQTAADCVFLGDSLAPVAVTVARRGRRCGW